MAILMSHMPYDNKPLDKQDEKEKGGAERRLNESAKLTRFPVPRRKFPSVYRRPAKTKEIS